MVVDIQNFAVRARSVGTAWALHGQHSLGVGMMMGMEKETEMGVQRRMVMVVGWGRPMNLVLKRDGACRGVVLPTVRRQGARGSGAVVLPIHRCSLINLMDH